MHFLCYKVRTVGLYCNLFYTMQEDPKECHRNVTSAVHLIGNSIVDVSHHNRDNFSFFPPPTPEEEIGQEEDVNSSFPRTAFLFGGDEEDEGDGEMEEEQKKASIVMDVIVEAIFIVGEL